MAEAREAGGRLSTPRCPWGRTAGRLRFCVENRRLRCTLRGVVSQMQHPLDIHLAEKCIAHDPDALARLQSTCGEPVLAYLVKTGATRDEAQETVECLWGDLLTPAKSGQVRLQNYDGSCKLLTWLNSVALNALLTRKRIDGRRQRRFPSSDVGGEIESPDDDRLVETPLLDLLRDAVQFAFGNCKPEDFVLLQLEYCDRLEREELALMFGCSKATVSRLLSSARVTVAESTKNFLRQRDPWLELQWEDFLELCRTATPACFGIED